MLLIAQTIGAASANANNRNGLGSNRSDCGEAAQPMRAEAEVVSVIPCFGWVIYVVWGMSAACPGSGNSRNAGSLLPVSSAAGSDA
jgi:hypothetical protein